MLNWVFLFLVGGAVLIAAFNGTMQQVTAASLSSAKGAVELVIGLIGQMALWLGFMRVLQDAGLMRSVARGLRPVMTRLFPDVPAEHPAMGAMIMNVAANVAGLGNAATPFGLKAMRELDKLNRHPGVTTNAMTLFLAINTSGVAVLPLGVIAVRATLGSNDPAGIVVPSLIATIAATVVAVIATKALQGRRAFSVERAVEETAHAPGEKPAEPLLDVALEKAEESAVEVPPSSGWRRAVVAAVWLAVVASLVMLVSSTLGTVLPTTDGRPAGLTDLGRTVMSDWLLPLLMLAIVTFGFGRGTRVYESFVTGAKEGFSIAISIIPFLVAILVAIGMFRASGGMEAMVTVLAPVTGLFGMPAETLPMALIRPLSGSGALAVMTEAMRTHGPDSLIGYMVSVMSGSTETTFYVLAVYYGSVQVRATRHTVPACVAADVTGILMAVLVTHLYFG